MSRRIPMGALVACVVGAGLLLAGCQKVSGTPIAAVVLPVSSGSAASPSPFFPSTSEPDARTPTGASSSTGLATDAATDPATDQPQSLNPTEYPEGDGVDPCQLLNQQDAEKLVGTPLDPPVRGDHACSYTGPVTGPTAQVEIYVGLGAKKQLDIENTLGHPVNRLPGIGDEAWISDTGAYVREGQLWISVLVVLLEDPPQYAKRLTDAATVAAGRL